MKTESLIEAKTFCLHHKVELSFIHSLHNSGLIQVINIENNFFVPEEQVSDLERFVRLYYEMDINIEGIETISYLLQRMNELQTHVNNLSNRLRLYEE